MMFKWPTARSWSSFFTLHRACELRRVALPADTNLAISEWADREMKSRHGKGVALRAADRRRRSVQFSALAINTMGSQRRMAMALQRESIDDLAQEIQLILKRSRRAGSCEGWSLLKQGIHPLHARPKHSKEGACLPGWPAASRNVRMSTTLNVQPSMKTSTLRHLPILKCWPKHGGAFHQTLPNVHTEVSGYCACRDVSHEIYR